MGMGPHNSCDVADVAMSIIDTVVMSEEAPLNLHCGQDTVMMYMMYGCIASKPF